MNWSITGDRPVYLQLIEQMERAIVAGEYKAGARLPGVRELAAEAAVNPNTMQRALQELEARGLVNTQRTAGRTVTDDAARIAQLRRQLALRQAEAFLNAMRALGYEKPETLALLEGLEVPATDASEAFAAIPGAHTNESLNPAKAPNAFAAAPRVSANMPDAPADAADDSRKVRNISKDAANPSASTPNTPSQATGRK